MAMNKKYVVRLEDEERARLEALVSQGRAAARTIQRCLDLTQSRCRARRTRLVRRRDPAGLRRGAGDHLSRPADPRGARLDCGVDPAPQVAASAPETGRRTGGPSDRIGVQPAARGTSPVDRAVAGHQVRRVGIHRSRRPGDRATDAQKNELKPHLVKMWCIPPRANAEFVWRMEDVLETYKLPYDPRFPVVCMDETSKQLVGEVRAPDGG